MKRYLLIMITALTAFVTSCERRDLVEPSNAHYVRVYIDEDIKNVTMGFHPNNSSRLNYSRPDILRLLLCDPRSGEVKMERFLRTRKEDKRGVYFEGHIVADPGVYNLMAYSFDTEVCIVKDYMNYNTGKVYTNKVASHIMPNVTVQTDNRIVYDPDVFFMANYPGLYIPYTDVPDTLRTSDMDYFKAESLVEAYYLQVPVKGIKYATSSIGLISGLAGSAWLGKSAPDLKDPVTLCLELQPGEDNAAGILGDESDASGDTAIMYTTFCTFGQLPDVKHKFSITFDFITTHGGSHSETIDITDEFTSSLAQDKHWIIVDQVIELPEPVSNPNNSGGGFNPDVEDWEDVETDVIL